MKGVHVITSQTPSDTRGIQRLGTFPPRLIRTSASSWAGQEQREQFSLYGIETLAYMCCHKYSALSICFLLVKHTQVVPERCGRDCYGLERWAFAVMSRFLVVHEVMLKGSSRGDKMDGRREITEQHSLISRKYVCGERRMQNKTQDKVEKG